MEANRPDVGPDKNVVTPARRRSRWLIWPLRVLGLFAGLLVVVLMMAQTPRGARWIKTVVENQVTNLLSNARLEIESLSGSFIFGASGHNLKLYAGDSLVVSIDEVDIEYNVLDLLLGNIDLEDVRLIHPRVVANQQPDSTWDILSIVPPSSAPDTAPRKPTVVSVDNLNIVDGLAEARFQTGKDSTVHLANLNVSASGLSVGETIRAERFLLAVQGQAASLPAPVNINVDATLQTAAFSCNRCELTSARSRLGINGFFDWRDGSDTPGADFEITVDSLSLADLVPFVPMLDETQVVSGRASLRGPIDSVVAIVDIDVGAGRFEASGALIRRDSIRVLVDARVQSLDPSDFWVDSAVSGAASGALSVDLRGQTLQSLTGNSSFKITDSVLNDRPVKNSNVSIEFRDGRANIVANVELPFSHLELEGWTIPFADTLEWGFNGSASSSRFQEIYPDLTDLESFSFRFHTTGNSASRADYFQDFDIGIDALVYAGFVVDSTDLSAHLLDEGVGVTGRGRVNSESTGESVGSFDFDGSALLREAIQIEMKRLTFSGLDVGLGSASGGPVSDLSGAVSASIEISPTRTVIARGNASVSGEFLSYPVDDLKLDGKLEGGQLSLDAALQSGRALLDILASVRLQEEGIPVRARGTFRDLDLSVYTGDSTMISDLAGALRVESRWTSLADHHIRFETDLDSSSWNRQIIESGRIKVDSENGSAAILATLETPKGGADVQGQMILTDSSATLIRLDGTFTSLRLGDMLGLDYVSTNLNGGVNFKRLGEAVVGTIEIGPSSINRSVLKSGQVGLSMSADSMMIEGLVRFDTGKIKLVGDSRTGSRGSDIQAVVQIDSVDVAALIGRSHVSSSVNVGCSVAGTIAGPADSDLSGLCLAVNSQLGKTIVDSLRIEAAIRSQTLSVDTVVVRSNVADIDGSGTAYLGQPSSFDPEGAVSDLQIAVIVRELEHLEEILDLKLLEGEGSVNVSITGKPGKPNIDVEPHLEYLSYNDIRASTVDGYVSISDLEPLTAEAVIDVGFSVLSGFPVQKTSISLLADPEAVIFVADVTQLDNRRASLSATYTPLVGYSELRIDDLTMNLAGTVWKLSQEAVVEVGESWIVKQFLIFNEDGQIAVDGVVDLDGEQNLIFTAEEVETSAFIDLFGIKDVGGALEGFLVLSGQADSLIADASFSIRDMNTRGVKAGDLAVEMDFADGRLNVEGRIDHISGHSASITGSVPMNLTLRGEQTVYEADPLNLVVAADSLPLDWTLAFLDQSLVSNIGGLLDADLRISGTWKEPVLEGSGNVSKGLVMLPEFNTELTDVDADLSLSGNVLSVNQLIASTGLGRISGTGHVDFETLADLGLDLDLEFENFRAITTETYRFTVSGTAQVSGSMRSPVVAADVLLGPGSVSMTEELLADEIEPVTLTPRDLRTLERRFGYRIASQDTTTSDFVDALALDARVNIGRDVWLRSSSNPSMDIEFGGDLTVRKAPFSDQRIIGTINVNPSRSRIIQFARRFGVDRGSITFNGPVEEAVIDFRAVYNVPSRFGGDEARILLALTGLMNQLRLDITSEPQMDDAAIASYLLTGRPPDQAAISGEQAAEIAIGGVSRLVESFANENFGLDVVEIEASGTQGTRLTVGKYLSPKTYVFVKQPLSTDSNTSTSSGSRTTEIGLEYELWSWLIAEVSSRRGNFRGNLKWQLSF